eukprot:TRINITY_DN13314_c0_g1_i1.p1 TRINITY_DN13314_c0_g1~~TRINITY_DN13314_c0_g1_i1.p1  ORF type:complete len:124 (-),score=28.87 TRINITY_DN13314_c0_g1_i1:48-419(-)
MAELSEERKKEPLFDPSRLTEVSDGDKDFEADLIEIYRETCEQKLPLLEEALKSKDKDNSVLFSHDIKGSSANLGAERVRKISGDMEMNCRNEDYDKALEDFPLLNEQLQATYKVLEDFLNPS